MPARKVVCPHCSRPLKARKPPTEGHLILCPRCGRSFRVSSEAVAAPAVRAAPRETTASLAERDTASHPALVTDTAPHTPVPSAAVQSRTGSAPAKGPGAGGGERSRLLAVLILGGLAATMLLTFLLVLYFAARRPASSTHPDPGHATGPAEGDGRAETPGGDDSSPPPTEAPPEEPWLPSEGQAEVDAAIERGVAFLKKQQDPFGSWGPGDQHHVGLAALPGLTLLECGVPADDICIQKAAEHIRKNVPSLTWTYDIALSILFLDKLGLEEDRPLIRTLALRLVAGQMPSGGWTYNCPLLPAKDERDLEHTLELMRPRSPMDLFTQAPAGAGEPGAAPPSGRPGSTMPLDEPSRRPGTGLDGLADPKAFKKARNALPVHLRQLPALQTPARGRRLPPDNADNSNTQFAILGLWAAGRQNLPLERSLALLVQRFRQFQSPQGGWSYQAWGGPATEPMTCAGLLGLAVGHGLSASANPAAQPQRLPRDPAVEKGFRLVARIIGQPGPWMADRAKQHPDLNMYLMWSLERVGVLYNRRKIDGRDWYAWGAQLIVDVQQNDGAWRTGIYPGAQPITNTSFALLFLKRANLARDLTKKLEFLFEGKRID